MTTLLVNKILGLRPVPAQKLELNNNKGANVLMKTETQGVPPDADGRNTSQERL